MTGIIKGKAPSLEETQVAIEDVCDDLKSLLLQKNSAYGNSAIDPQRIFSFASPIEQINVRIDDKLSRIKSLTENPDRDSGNESLQQTEQDLLGYLVLKEVSRRLLINKKKIKQNYNPHGIENPIYHPSDALSSNS